MKHLILAAAIAIAPMAALAQTDSAAAKPQIGPPIRRIATASALSTEQIGSIIGVVELRDGRVLVNDGTRRRLLLMDTTLNTVGVVLDSLAEVANTYGTRPGALIPYRGDSTLFVDPASYVLIVLDPEAKIARVRSVWRIDDMFMVTNPGGTYGWPGVDARGRIVYRIFARPSPPKVAPPPGVPYIPPDPDSAFIVAMDIDTRKQDTIGSIRIPKSLFMIKQTPEGGFNFFNAINPLPQTDDWAVLPDGAIAFVRGRDYRVEYLGPDGKLTSAEKLPFDWQRMTEESKQKLVDSVKNVNQRAALGTYINAMIRWANTYNRPYPPKFSVPDGFVPTPGLMKEWKLPENLKLPANYIYGCPPGVEPTITAPAAGAAPAPLAPGMPNFSPPGMPGGTPSCIPSPIMFGGGQIPPPPQMRETPVMPPEDLPDYRPPFGASSVRADADGNLWIRTIPPKPIPGGNVYDIVSRKGELVDRLQIPPGYTVVGFGKGRVVYLSMRDAKGIHLARVRLRLGGGGKRRT
jgi:hypothetical protein